MVTGCCRPPGVRLGTAAVRCATPGCRFDWCCLTPTRLQPSMSTTPYAAPTPAVELQGVRQPRRLRAHLCSRPDRPRRHLQRTPGRRLRPRVATAALQRCSVLPASVAPNESIDACRQPHRPSRLCFCRIACVCPVFREQVVCKFLCAFHPDCYLSRSHFTLLRVVAISTSIAYSTVHGVG
jgi:hypothetical protein